MTDREHCTGCGACAAVCPHNAIDMAADSEGFVQPVIRKDACADCGLCRRVCPVNQTAGAAETPLAYLAYARDARLRLESSSGGIFSALAEAVLDEGGIVYGCAMTGDGYGAEHIAVEDPAELYRLRGSKYVQSSAWKVLPGVREEVLKGRQVLFCGTPCQAAGLRALLGEKSHDNLLLVDVICHGAPSPLVWENYVRQKEREKGAKMVQVSFRDKRTGWKRYSLSMTFADGSRYTRPVNQDPYLRGFVQNLYARRSCCGCTFKGIGYRSDLTLGDFWGVRRIRPELEESEGVSLILPHTPKGRQAASSLAERCHMEPVDPEIALKSNPSYFTGAQPNALRGILLKRIIRDQTGRRMEEYTSDSPAARGLRKIGTILKRG